MIVFFLSFRGIPVPQSSSLNGPPQRLSHSLWRMGTPGPKPPSPAAPYLRRSSHLWYSEEQMAGGGHESLPATDGQPQGKYGEWPHGHIWWQLRESNKVSSGFYFGHKKSIFCFHSGNSHFFWNLLFSHKGQIWGRESIIGCCFNILLDQHFVLKRL